MKRTAAAIATMIISIVTAGPASAQLKKIRFSTSSIAVTEMQFRIAQMKGFYREEGLDLETVLIRGSVGMQALIGGSVEIDSARRRAWRAGAARFDRQREAAVRPCRPARSEIGRAAQGQSRRYLFAR